MFLTIKPYLHLNCVLMINWIIWNWTVFDIKTVSKVKLATIVEGDPKAPFSIAYYTKV